jgi:hypothetical protein
MRSDKLFWMRRRQGLFFVEVQLFVQLLAGP